MSYGGARPKTFSSNNNSETQNETVQQDRVNPTNRKDANKLKHHGPTPVKDVTPKAKKSYSAQASKPPSRINDKPEGGTRILEQTTFELNTRHAFTYFSAFVPN